MWFEDRYLNTDSLRLFEDVIKNPKVKSIRILTSLVHNKQINDEFLNKIREFKKISSDNKITLEVKVASTKRLHKKNHNRYVLGNNILWDLPPSGLVLDGQSSSTFKEFKLGTKSYEKISKDYVDWWNDSEALEITAKWDQIKLLVELYSKKMNIKREMYYANCTICGIAIKVPFVPDPKIPVYCQEHLKFKKNKKYFN